MFGEAAGKNKQLKLVCNINLAVNLLENFGSQYVLIHAPRMVQG